MLSPERQSVQMSKITNDSLTRSGTGCFRASCTYMATVGVKGVSWPLILNWITLQNRKRKLLGCQKIPTEWVCFVTHKNHIIDIILSRIIIYHRRITYLCLYIASQEYIN